MAEKTGIAWCDSTFNPWLGCTKVSPACDHCYAEKFGKRIGVEWGAGKARRRTSASTWQQPLRWNAKPFYECKNCGLRTDNPMCAQCIGPERSQHLWRPTRRRVFCGSLCDVFDNEVPNEWRFDLFRLIESTPHLCWLLLTKRIGNANAMLPFKWKDGVRANVWIGATICNQEEADRDIPKLLKVPAAKHFLSIEPMLGPVDIERFLSPLCESGSVPGPYGGGKTCPRCDGAGNCPSLDWVICGGETGKHARPMHPSWVRSLRDQCVAAGTAFWFKQWGGFLPDECCTHSQIMRNICVPMPGERGDKAMIRVGHKAAGNMLDGRTWTEVPA